MSETIWFWKNCFRQKL